MMAFYDGVGDVLNRVIERSKKNLKEKRRKRNVAAILDFASNLLVTAGNANGARLAYRPQLLPKYEKSYNDAYERLSGFIRDVNGKVAYSKLWEPVAKAKKSEQSYGVKDTLLLSGSFDKALKNYKESTGFNDVLNKEF